MPESFKKIALRSAIASAFVVMATTIASIAPMTAFAQSGLHFVGDVNSDVSGSTVTVSGEVAGAGKTATATLTGTADVTQGCVNKGDNEPKGLRTTTEDISVSDTFNTRSGRGSFSLSFTAEGDPDFECPSANMREVTVGVEFNDLTLTVTSQTGTISEEITA